MIISISVNFLDICITNVNSYLSENVMPYCSVHFTIFLAMAMKEYALQLHIFVDHFVLCVLSPLPRLSSGYEQEIPYLTSPSLLTVLVMGHNDRLGFLYHTI